MSRAYRESSEVRLAQGGRVPVIWLKFNWLTPTCQIRSFPLGVEGLQRIKGGEIGPRGKSSVDVVELQIPVARVKSESYIKATFPRVLHPNLT